MSTSVGPPKIKISKESLKILATSANFSGYHRLALP